MDPQTAWNEMLDAIQQRDWPGALESAEALLAWMKKGGFPPQTTAVAMRPQWNRATAEFGCLLALQIVRQVKKRKQRKEANE